MIRTKHLVLMVVILTVASSLLAREWVDSSGKHKVEAEFVKLEGEIVHLRKANGKIIGMPVDRLSEADQAYARDRRLKKADDKDRIAEKPVPKVGSLKELRKLSKKARRAKHVLAVYQKFLENPSVSDDEKEEARSGIKRWEDLAAIDGQKLGREFLTPDEVKDRQARATDLVKIALKQLATGADAAAQKKLKEASKLDPDSLQADLISGVVRAVFRHKSEEAEKFFDIAVKRGRRQSGSLDAVGESNYAAALNNLALVKVRQRKLSAAYSCWKDLLEARPRPESEVIQNIGRVRALAARGQGTKSPAFLHPSRSVLKRFETLYGNLAIEGNAMTFEARTGWLYIPPILRGEGAEETVEIGAPGSGPMDSQDMRIVGWGSGFVVHPGYILTNRHVVRDERRKRNYPGFRLQKADFLGERYPGRVLAVSERFDLALIKSDGLVAKPVSLLDRRPRLSEEIMVLGFPRPKALGFRFTTTKGIISSLPNRNFSQVLYDAISNAGNSGGPTVDIRGNAVAVHSIALVFGGKNAQSYAGGVLCTDVIPFLSRNIPNYRPNTRRNKFADWATVTEVLDEAVVAIEILATTESLAGLPDAFAGKRDRKESWRALEDPWCMVCGGWGERKCPNKKCKNGTVRDFRWRVIRRPGVPDERVRDPIRVPCRTCRGQNKIRCVYCDDGFGP